jgi:hypothetical protein
MRAVAIAAGVAGFIIVTFLIFAPPQYWDAITGAAERNVSNRSAGGSSQADGDDEKTQESVDSGFVAGGIFGSGGTFGVPGAVICQNYDTVRLVLDSFQEARNERAVDAVSGGAESLMHGAMSPPNPEDYGCSMVPTGGAFLSVQQAASQVILIVSARLPSGRVVRGVTDARMVQFSEEEIKRRQIESDRKAQIQERVRTIMAPEEKRHTLAVEEEDKRYQAALRQLPEEHDTPKIKEEFYHRNAIEAENQRYQAAEQAAEQQAEQEMNGTEVPSRSEGPTANPMQ